MKYTGILVSLLGLMSISALAQDGGFAVEPDTVEQIDGYVVKAPKARMFTGRPGKAALYSLILPGAGQIYNKRFWKVPLVWGAVGGVGFVMVDNTKQYKLFRDIYRDRLIADMEDMPYADDYTFLNNEQIRNERERWNRYRQMSIVFFALSWIANSAEAFVDAHLMEFDTSDDLTIQLRPADFDPAIATVQTGIVVKF
jgi:hypothetical protein